MAGEALGLVEVRGMLGAVVAADAALKAANVTLLMIEPVKAGIRNVQLNGDVAAVRAAVDAAVEAIRDLNCYMGSHVIARVDEQTKRIYGPTRAPQKEKEAPNVVEEVNDLAVEVVKEETEPTSSESVKKVKINSTDELGKRYTREELEQFKVVKLREIAYKTEGIGLTKKEIKFGNKQTLIDALLK